MFKSVLQLLCDGVGDVHCAAIHFVTKCWWERLIRAKLTLNKALSKFENGTINNCLGIVVCHYRTEVVITPSLFLIYMFLLAAMT
jgi:hypothetical protein